MPELPEVETIRAQLAPRLEGRTLTRVEILDPRLTRPHDLFEVAEELEGDRVVAVERRGKYLLLRLASGFGLLVHLRMTGGFHWQPVTHERAVLELDDGTRLGYRDMRRFGTWLVLEGAELEPYLATKNGPEPLGPRFTHAWLAGQLARRRAPLKAVLLDQRVVAGLGNIYTDKALWRSRLSPLRPANDLSREEVARLTRAIRATLRTGIERQGRPCATTPLRTALRARCRTNSASTGGTASPVRAAERRSRRRAWAAADLVLPPLPALAVARPTLASWSARTRRRPLCCGRSASARRPRPPSVHGRARSIGAMAKGVRKTKSRFGARLEPFSHVELMLHQGSGELYTVTGVSLVDAHRRAREDSYRLSVGLVGAEAMLRLFVEEERNERVFEALTRFLAAVDAIPAGSRGRAALDPVALAFQLKLLWLSGYVPHLESCVDCGGPTVSSAISPSRGSGVLALRTRRDGLPLAGLVSGNARAHLEPALRSTWPRSRRTRAARRASRWSSPHTSFTAASACARSPYEARPRRRLRARRRSGADRSRCGARRSDVVCTGPKGGRV